MILDEIGSKLTTAGIVGGASGWTLAQAFMPPTPDKIVSIFETGSDKDPEITTDYEYITIQVRVRGSKFGYEATSAKVDAVMDTLHNADINTLVYIYARTSKLLMGYDGNDRPEIVQNYHAMRLRT